MQPSLNLAATGFSAQNALVLAGLSQEVYSAPPDITGTLKTAVIVRDLGSCIVVAFQGTKSIEQFITDAQFWRVPRMGGLPGVEVHAGFFHALCVVQPRLVSKLTAMGVCSLKPVIVTGHSLGGALAILAAQVLVSLLPPGSVHSCYTFGQPRVGNAAWAKDYDTTDTLASTATHDQAVLLRDVTFRLINAEDIVPRLPGYLLGNRHAATEVFLSSTGDVTINPSLWEKGISDAVGLAKFYFTHQERFLGCHRIARYLDRLSSL